MDIVRVAAFAVAAAIGASQAFGQSHEPDWRVSGYTGKDVILYSTPDIARELDGVVLVWTEQLNFKASQQAVARADKNKRFTDAISGRYARSYVPPFMLAGVSDSCKSSQQKDCVANTAVHIAMIEEAANEKLVRTELRTLYELDCKNKRARPLQAVMYANGGSPNVLNDPDPAGWTNAPPQSNLEWLLTIVCNPAIATVDNSPHEPGTRAGASPRNGQPR